MRRIFFLHSADIFCLGGLRFETDTEMKLCWSSSMCARVMLTNGLHRTRPTKNKTDQITWTFRKWFPVMFNVAFVGMSHANTSLKQIEIKAIFIWLVLTPFHIRKAVYVVRKDVENEFVWSCWINAPTTTTTTTTTITATEWKKYSSFIWWCDVRARMLIIIYHMVDISYKN